VCALANPAADVHAVMRSRFAVRAAAVLVAGGVLTALAVTNNWATLYW
jgi:hypothetical protein